MSTPPPPPPLPPLPPQGGEGRQGASASGTPGAPRIRFSQTTGFGSSTGSESSPGEDPSADAEAVDGIDVEEDESGIIEPVGESSGAPTGPKPRIRTFETQSIGQASDGPKRQPNKTGHGAVHVRTFHSKLNNDSLAFMDQVINEWLDTHPEYEVKFVSMTVGEFTGKLKEPAVICQVWV